jgi:hypothetical protein
MCPICASLGVFATGGVVSTAGLAILLVKLRGGRSSRGNGNVNRREMSS